MADMSPDQRNAINVQLRAQPWYQAWFQQRNLDPNHVHLNDAQRAELAKVAAQNGMPLPPHLIIDPAGNANVQHGFAGQPTWLKALEIGAPIAATAGFGLAGTGPLGFLGSSTAPALGAGEASTTLAGTGGLVPGVAGTADAGMAGGAASAIPSIAGLGAPAGVGTSVTTGPASIASSTIGGHVGGAPMGLADRFKNFLFGSNGTQNMSDAAKVLSGAGEAEANNRYKKADTTQGYDRLALQAAENRRLDESDAMKKLAIAGYIGQGGSHYQPSTIQLNGQQRTLPSFEGISPLPPSAAQQAGASTLEQQMLQRLQPGGSWKPTDPAYLNRGTMENIGNYGGLGLSLLGAAKNIFNF